MRRNRKNNRNRLIYILIALDLLVLIVFLAVFLHYKIYSPLCFMNGK